MNQQSACYYSSFMEVAVKLVGAAWQEFKPYASEYIRICRSNNDGSATLEDYHKFVMINLHYQASLSVYSRLFDFYHQVSQDFIRSYPQVTKFGFKPLLAEELRSGHKKDPQSHRATFKDLRDGFIDFANAEQK